MRTPSETSTVNTRLIIVISVAWALFQLSLPAFILLDSVKIRSIHLAFAMLLVFLSIPAEKGLPRIFHPFVRMFSWKFVIHIVSCLAAVSALYIMLSWNGIATRSGLPNTLDLVFGLLIVFFVLEASRRGVGPALAFIALLFIGYAFLGPYLPSVFAYRGVTLNKFLSQTSLSLEGIYGIPLRVSARIVYLFVLMGAILERAGAGQFFIRLALALLGRFRGGAR